MCLLLQACAASQQTPPPPTKVEKTEIKGNALHDNSWTIGEEPDSIRHDNGALHDNSWTVL